MMKTTVAVWIGGTFTVATAVLMIMFSDGSHGGGGGLLRSIRLGQQKKEVLVATPTAPLAKDNAGPLSLSSSLASMCGEKEWVDHPALCSALDWSVKDEEDFVDRVTDFARRHGLLVDLRNPSSPDGIESSPTKRSLYEGHEKPIIHLQQQGQLPVVTAHGMGDSCFNDGMQHVTNMISGWLDDAYGVCIPTGKTRSQDIRNGYFLNMDASVDAFAEQVRSNPHLQNGFHAVGFSQGNNVIRGYIAMHNDPPVHTFLSVNGVNAGVGAVPYCRPGNRNLEEGIDDVATSVNNKICELLMEQASHRAYTEFAQEHSFQANYWRDPRPSASSLYHRYGQLAAWNNEIPDRVNRTFADNWSRTSSFVWVLATEDEMVWPKEGEHWGAPDPNDPFGTILPMNQTEWYRKDLFGLKTAQEQGKNNFESFVGDHLQFDMDDLQRWITAYLRN